MKYNWQQNQWPKFDYSLSDIEGDLLLFADLAGQISGVVRGLEEADQSEAVVETMIAEAIKSSEIEGEFLSRPDVASSIRNCLGLKSDHKEIRDPASQGMAELMVDSRSRWSENLSKEKLFEWHRMLKEGPSGFEGGMNARKYAALTGVSKATATRDLQELVEKGVFRPIGGGRSTRYEAVL